MGSLSYFRRKSGNDCSKYPLTKTTFSSTLGNLLRAKVPLSNPSLQNSGKPSNESNQKTVCGTCLAIKLMVCPL